MFHFAGTLGSSEARSSHIVLQQVSHQLEHKTKVKYNPFAKLTISDKRQHAKEEQKVCACVCVRGGRGRGSLCMHTCIMCVHAYMNVCRLTQCQCVYVYVYV